MLITNDGTPDLVEVLHLESLHVHAPTPVLFHCGGPIEIRNVEPVMSLRDAFLRIEQRAAFRKFRHIYAEKDTFDLFRRAYKDWFQFEADLAELTQLTLLFCESAGSLAELGLFVSRSEIAANLLVVIDDGHNNAQSFVVEGCIDYLTSNYGIASVHVLHRDDVNIRSLGAGRVDFDVSGINLDSFYDKMSASVPPAIDAHGRKRAFSRDRTGHLAKLATGLIQHYGALTLLELEACFEFLRIQVSSERLEQFLACVELIGWVKKDRRGPEIYYVAATMNKMAIEYATVGGKMPKAFDWRISVREYWERLDKERFKSIQSALRAA